MKSQYLYLNSRDEFFRIDISKIVYFEADGNYTHIVLNNKVKGSVSMNLSRMQQLLADSLHESAATFARVGKSYIINLAYVYQIALLRQKLELSDGENFDYTLNISKEALKALREMYVSRIAESPATVNTATATLQ
jgi:DNA-binding LytR/AlgR family response regulator